MRRPCLYTAFLSVALLALPARAGFAAPPAPVFSGHDLRVLCVSASDLDYGFCAGYLSAVAQTLLATPIGTARACNHQNVRSQQFIDTYNAWADLFPDKMNLPAHDAAAAALARAFPCP